MLACNASYLHPMYPRTRPHSNRCSSSKIYNSWRRRNTRRMMTVASCNSKRSHSSSSSHSTTISNSNSPLLCDTQMIENSTKRGRQDLVRVRFIEYKYTLRSPESCRAPLGAALNSVKRQTNKQTNKRKLIDEAEIWRLKLHFPNVASVDHLYLGEEQNKNH